MALGGRNLTETKGVVMEKRRLKNAKAAALAAAYGVSLGQAAKAVEEDAPRPTVAAGETPADQAAGKPTAPADTGPKATSSQLALFYFLTRDQVEAELVRLGLRGPADDGSTLYPVDEVARRLAAEDSLRVAAAAELTDAFASDSFVEQAVQEALTEMKEKWLIDSGLHGELAALKQGILAKLKKTHMYQQSQRAGDIWEALAAIEEFGRALLAAISARRQQKAETRGNTDV